MSRIIKKNNRTYHIEFIKEFLSILIPIGVMMYGIYSICSALYGYGDVKRWIIGIVSTVIGIVLSVVNLTKA